MDNRFGDVSSVLGYAVLTVGLALILHPAARDVACAAVLGALVGVLRQLGRGRRTVEALMPFLAATCVSAIVALAVKYDVTDPGLRAMIASLVVFIPGVALTTAFLELTEGQMVAGSSRLVWGGTQLGLLAFGIVAGIGMVGVSAQRAFSSSDALLGSWAPWLGVLVFAVGVTIAHSAPPGSFPSLLVVLYAAWIGQVVGNELFGAYASGFTGALVMTVAAYLLARRPSTMPVYAVFLAGFWLLVPGSLGLIGLTTVLAIPESASTEDILAIVASIAAVALGVLCGVEFHAWVTRVGRPHAACGAKGRLTVRCILAANRSLLYAVTVRVAIVAVVDRSVLHVARPGPRDPQRGRGAEQRLALRPPGSPGLPVGEVDGARLPDWRRRRARECARDRVDGRGELARRAARPGRRCLLRPALVLAAVRGAGSGRRRPRGCASPQPRPRAHGGCPSSGIGQPWPSPSSCSRFSSSSSSGRCSGSRSARAGRRRQTR